MRCARRARSMRCGTRTARVCLMHMQGEPRTMQAAPHYDDVVGEVKAFLARAHRGLRSGRHRARAARDRSRLRFRQERPAQSRSCCASLGALRELGVPVLAGLSRKSTLGYNHRPGERRIALRGERRRLLCWRCERGASIVRVHDVAATRDALLVLRAVQPGSRFNETINDHDQKILRYRRRARQGGRAADHAGARDASGLRRRQGAGRRGPAPCRRRARRRS